MVNLWVDHYRPHCIKDIVQQDEIKHIIENAIVSNSLTHMLFYGPPGTGKTSTALAMVKEMFCKTSDIILNQKVLQERTLELNASDERGIKVVREKIKTFASASLNNHYNHVPPFKVIILDEADAMTNDSQFALRRIIEKYTHITRFILVCNYVTKIITPLSSRCTKLRFQQISPTSLQTIVHRIKEVDINCDCIEYVYEICGGDLRKAINIIQRASYINKKVTKDIISEISGQIPEKHVELIWNKLKGQITYPEIVRLAKNFCDDGYSSLCLVNNLFQLVMKDDLDDTQKGKMLLALSDIDYYINDNANEFIQIVKMFSNLTVFRSIKS
jgi:replication factor C subunit 2/4